MCCFYLKLISPFSMLKLVFSLKNISPVVVSLVKTQRLSFFQVQLTRILPSGISTRDFWLSVQDAKKAIATAATIKIFFILVCG